MPSVEINGQSWTLLDDLGSGGYGRVFLAVCGTDYAAIKLVSKQPGADREILVADRLRGLPGVVPILGTGETSTDWVLLMPYADRSLAKAIETEPLAEAAARRIITQLAHTLVEVEQVRIIHRDLKPENILELEGSWCIADFGIAKYADAATSADTFKFSTTRSYMAPEQWREEFDTPRSDIYALGAIAYELIMGRKAFDGSGIREQHLHGAAPKVVGVSNEYASLVEDCLSKRAESRPGASEVLQRISGQLSASTSSKSLSDANLLATRQRNDLAIVESRKRTRDELHRDLKPIAERRFAEISQSLCSALQSAAPAGTLESLLSDRQTERELARGFSGSANPLEFSWRFHLGDITLLLSEEESGGWIRNQRLFGSGPFSEADRLKIPFNVVKWAYITLGKTPNRSRYFNGSEYLGRAHSLWFCNAEDRDHYNWFEIGFRKRSQSGIDNGPMAVDYFTNYDDGRTTDNYSPLALNPYLERAYEMFVPAYGPRIVNAQTLAEFTNRWSEWLGESVRRGIRPPKRNIGSWLGF